MHAESGGAPDLDLLTVREVIDATGIGVFDVDALSGRCRISDSCRAILGPARDEEPTCGELIGFVHRADRHLVEPAIASLAPDGPGEFVVEHRVIRRDGALRWLRTRGVRRHGRVGRRRDLQG